MNARHAGHIETGVELIASAAFAGAVAFAAFATLRSSLPQPQVYVLATAAAAFAFLLVRLVTRPSPRKTSFRTPAFELPEFEAFEADELVLSEEHRVEPEELVLREADRVDSGVEALELDDVLAAISPDSRVVRLFDRKAMPTPGQLHSQIEDHLGQRTAVPVQDASKALSDALAELRRSLR